MLLVQASPKSTQLLTATQQHRESDTHALNLGSQNSARSALLQAQKSAKGHKGALGKDPGPAPTAEDSAAHTHQPSKPDISHHGHRLAPYAGRASTSRAAPRRGADADAAPLLRTARHEALRSLRAIPHRSGKMSRAKASGLPGSSSSWEDLSHLQGVACPAGIS